MSVVHDVNSRCDVFWISRTGDYDLSVLLGDDRDARRVIDEFDKSNGAGWLRSLPPNATKAYGSDVIACEFAKDVDQPVGVFSFVLKSDQHWEDRLFPGDLVFIYMSDDATFTTDPQSGTLVTVGIIDRVVVSVSVDNGAEVRTVSVNGRDLGAIFQETSTVFDPAFAYIEQLYFDSDWYSEMYDSRAAVSAIEVVLSLLRLFYTNSTQSKLAQFQWQFYSNANGEVHATPRASIMSLVDVTSFVQVPMFGYDIPDSIGLAQAGNVWTLMSGFTNSVINEFFFDVRDFNQSETSVIAGLSQLTKNAMRAASPDTVDEDAQAQSAARFKLFQTGAFAHQNAVDLKRNILADRRQVPALVFRQRPYDTYTFSLLPVTVVEHTEVFDTDLQLSHHDVYNVFRVKCPSLEDSFQEFTYEVRINIDSMYRYGLRQMEAQTRFFFPSSKLASSGNAKTQDFDASFEYYVGLLSTWYAANERMQVGQMSLRFRPSIRVGTRLRHNREDSTYDYYVQSVRHSFHVNPGLSRTSVTLTRGVDVNGNTVVNNLYLTDDGKSGIPPQYNTFGKFVFKDGNTKLEPEDTSGKTLFKGLGG